MLHDSHYYHSTTASHAISDVDYKVMTLYEDCMRSADDGLNDYCVGNEAEVMISQRRIRSFYALLLSF